MNEMYEKLDRLVDEDPIALRDLAYLLYAAVVMSAEVIDILSEYVPDDIPEKAELLTLVQELKRSVKSPRLDSNQ